MVADMEKLLTPEEIEERAIAHGWAMSKACREAGIAPSTFSRWKAGVSSPSIAVYQRLVDVVSRLAPHIRVPQQ